MVKGIQELPVFLQLFRRLKLFQITLFFKTYAQFIHQGGG